MLDQDGIGGTWHWDLIVTASVITTIPVIEILFGQRAFIDGISTTGSTQ